MAKTDSELVAETLRGDPEAFEEIVRRYQTKVFGIIYHYLGRRAVVADIAQEVFLKLFRSLSKFDTSRSMDAWISKIAVNSCYDELRRERSRKATLFSDLGRDDEDRLESFYSKFTKGAYLTEVEVEELVEVFQRLISQLAEKDRMALVLREVEGMSYGEIASIMGATELAVRVRVSRSRQQLLEKLKGMDFLRGSG